ncbi:MAG: bile acid:sodium symporter family protein [Zetaproteobacteria bacterium]|nr:bile acid:sodium symporter family protein [Zetaproteobacteria bacterium]
MIWTFLSRNLALLTVVCAVAAYLYPPAFLIFKDLFLWLFALTMFALGVVLDPDEAKMALGKPKMIVLGLCTQYTVMPILGFMAASMMLLLNQPPALALGFIIVACAPGAMASNVVTYLAGGAVAFSIAMTLVATMLSPLITPLLVELLGGAILEIPFGAMMWTIVWSVVLPLLLGMFLRRYLGGWQERAEDVAPGIAALSIVIICGYAVAANHDRIADVSIWLFLLVVVLNGLGYLLGWAAATMFRFDQAHRLTLSIEVGMQNAGLGVALALQHFAPETALPGALFAVWCILTAAAMTRVLSRKSTMVSAI